MSQQKTKYKYENSSIESLENEIKEIKKQIRTLKKQMFNLDKYLNKYIKYSEGDTNVLIFCKEIKNLSHQDFEYSFEGPGFANTTHNYLSSLDDHYFTFEGLMRFTIYNIEDINKFQVLNKEQFISEYKLASEKVVTLLNMIENE